MKKYILLLFFWGIFSGLSAADKLAVSEPVGKGVPKEELNLVWNMLEANIGPQYELITRNALKSMLTEIGLTDDSGLVDLSSAQKAKLGQLKTVKYILVSNLNKSGTRYTLSLMVLDASTGEIIPGKKDSVTVNSIRELTDKLKDILRNMGIGPAVKSYGRSAVLTPIYRIKNVPAYLTEELTVNLENTLIGQKFSLQNLHSVTAILRKNGIGTPGEEEPAMYARIGDLLHVDYLLQLYVTRFSIRTEKRNIAVTQRVQTRHLGDISCSLRIISAQTGKIVNSKTFSNNVDFDDLDLDTDDWGMEDYGRYLIKAILPDICKFAVFSFRK